MSFVLPIPFLVAAVSTADPGRRRDEFYDSRGIGLLPATTLVIWVCCLIVGIIGIFWPGNPSSAPTTQPQSIAIEAVDVEVMNHPPDMTPASDQLPPQITALAPQVPPPLAATLFPDPLTPLTRLMQMPPRSVIPVALPLGAAPVNTLAVKTITFGVGEGRQPTPEYPEEARYAGEEGTVTILFNVDQDGRVTSATAATPCPWPILNQAAVSAVRQTWHFGPGPPRTYIVAIRYQLTRR